MDGLVNLENVLVVGMTNRKELLDEALLRPGRMEVKQASLASVCSNETHQWCSSQILAGLDPVRQPPAMLSHT